MRHSATFDCDGVKLMGELVAEPSSALVFVTSKGIVHGVDDLRRGKVVIVLDRGQEPTAEVLRLRDRAIAEGVETMIGHLSFPRPRRPA